MKIRRIRNATSIGEAVLEAIHHFGGTAKREKILDWVAWNYGFRGWRKSSVCNWIYRHCNAPKVERTSYGHYARARRVVGQIVAAKVR